MTTRSTRAALAKLLAVLVAFTLFAAACGDDGDSAGDGETEDPFDELDQRARDYGLTVCGEAD